MLWALALLVLILPTDAGAQEVTATLQMGRVVVRLVDAQTGAPVVGALLIVGATNKRAVSDSTGTALFTEIAPGNHQLRVRHLAYGEQTMDFEVEGTSTTAVSVELVAEAVVVSPINVVIESRPRFLEEQGFYTRRSRGLGTFFDPPFVEKWNVGAWARADQFVQLLKDMSPPFRTIRGLCNQPVVFVDGQEVFDDDGRLGGRVSAELEMMSTYMIGAAEVYSDQTGVPDFAMMPEAACGVISIWTNRWRGRERRLGGADVVLCDPTDPNASTIEGVIRDEFTNVLLSGAHVFATVYPPSNTAGARTYEIVSNKDARYRVCDIPPDHVVTIRAEAANRANQEVIVPMSGRIVAHDITIRVAGLGELVGRVIDRETGNPVGAADIRVRTTGVDRGVLAQGQTDAAGFFALEEVHPGDHLVEVRHLGFGQVVETVSIVADRTAELHVEMSADPIELQPIVVTGLRSLRLDRRGFYERRMWGERTGRGEFLEGGDINQGVASTTSLLRNVSGLRVRCSGRDCVVGSTSRSNCLRMNVYLDGTLALREDRDDAIRLDDLVRTSEIEAIEVYSGSTTAPAEFLASSSRCGAIVIWTK